MSERVYQIIETLTNLNVVNVKGNKGGISPYFTGN